MLIHRPHKHKIAQAEKYAQLAIAHDKKMLLATGNIDFWKEHLENKFPEANIEVVQAGLCISRRKAQ